MAFSRRLAQTTAPKNLSGAFAGGFVGCAVFGIDAVGVAGGELLEAVGRDGASLGEDGAFTLVGDLFEGLEGLFDVGRVEPGVELGDGDVVVVADIEDVDVGGEVVAEEFVFVEGVGES